MQYKTKFLHLIHMEECNTDDTRLLEYKLYTHTKADAIYLRLSCWLLTGSNTAPGRNIIGIHVPVNINDLFN